MSSKLTNISPKIRLFVILASGFRVGASGVDEVETAQQNVELTMLRKFKEEVDSAEAKNSLPALSRAQEQLLAEVPPERICWQPSSS